jgi:general secretion pathway protein A
MYHGHFRLTGPPFQATPTPEAVYLSQTHRESLAALEWGLLHETAGFTLLTGETGTGKTTLVSSILTRNLEQLRVAYIINSKLSFEEMLRMVLDQLGIKSDGSTKLDRIEALNNFLRCRKPGERVGIIVDEAQDLGEEVLEELRLLTNYGQRPDHYLQLILVGQPDLVRFLKRPSLRQVDQRIAARAILRPLTAAEAFEYVKYRLLVKNGYAEAIFGWHALQYLLRHSQGIPRKINVLCHNAMLTAYAANSHTVNLRAARAAVAEYEGTLLSRLQQIGRVKLQRWHLQIPNRRTLGRIASIGVFLVAAGQVWRIVVSKSSATHGQGVSIAATASHMTTAPSVLVARSATRFKQQSDEPMEGRLSSRILETAVKQGALGADAARMSEALRSVTADAWTEQKERIVVHQGDTLEKLAIRYFGSRRGLDDLVDANPQLTDIDHLRVGQTIYLSSRNLAAGPERVRARALRWRQEVKVPIR